MSTAGDIIDELHDEVAALKKQLQVAQQELKDFRFNYALAEQWGWRPDVAQIRFMEQKRIAEKMTAERDAALVQRDAALQSCGRITAMLDNCLDPTERSDV